MRFRQSDKRRPLLRPRAAKSEDMIVTKRSSIYQSLTSKANNVDIIEEKPSIPRNEKQPLSDVDEARNASDDRQDGEKFRKRTNKFKESRVRTKNQGARGGREPPTRHVFSPNLFDTSASQTTQYEKQMAGRRVSLPYDRSIMELDDDTVSSVSSGFSSGGPGDLFADFDHFCAKIEQCDDGGFRDLPH